MFWKNWFRKKPAYLHGTAGPDERPARKNIKTGVVEFVIWRAGEQGHSADFWTPFHEYWWPTFEAGEA